MATGDRIQIADKPTLDDVNAKLGGVSDTGTGSVFAKLNTLQSNSSKSPKPISTISKFVTYGNIIPATAGVTSNTYINVTGSGYIYLMLASHVIVTTGTTPTGSVRMVVDNVNVINRNIAVTAGNQGDSSGFITTDYASATLSSNYGQLTRVGFTGGSTTHYLLGSLCPIRGFNDSNLGITITPTPIRFENGFSVSLINTSSACSLSCIYLLD